MFGYPNRQKFLYAYGSIAAVPVIGALIRLAKFEQWSMRQHFQIFLFSILVIAASWEALRGVNRWMNRKYPFERGITKRIMLQVLAGIVIGLFVRYLIQVFAEPLVPFKLDRMFVAATWTLYAILPTAVNLIFFSDYFLSRWKESITYNERLEKEKAQVQFDNLKNQLNPHFLFNALASLNSLITHDQQLASEFLQQLSKVYRYVLSHKEKNLVDLQTELNFIGHYVKLLETRFPHSLKINFQIATDAKEKAIVPVTLQILIENAIKHNVIGMERPLVIDILTMGDYLVISNNLQPRQNVETSNKLGLENLKSLYKFLTDKPVVVEPTQERFYVKVPLL